MASYRTNLDFEIFRSINLAKPNSDQPIPNLNLNEGGVILTSGIIGQLARL